MAVLMPADGDHNFVIPDWFAFIDESGHGSFRGSASFDERFLCLTSLLIEAKAYRKHIVPYVKALKAHVFGTEEIVLHRNEIIRGLHIIDSKFSVLRDESIRRQFDAALIKLFQKANYKVCSVLIDKLEFQNSYPNWLPDTYAIAMENLVERICLWLIDSGETCKIIFEARGKHEDRRLQNEYSLIYERGTRYIAADKIQSVISSKEIDFHKKKENVIGLQLADLIGTDAKRRIVCDNYNIPLNPGFGSAIVDILYQDKYLRNPRSGRIEGYGVIVRK